MKIIKNSIYYIVLLFFFLLLVASLSYGKKQNVTAKIEGEIVAIFNEPQPDERDIPEILKVPYVAKIKVLKIIKSNENDSIFLIERRLQNNKPIPINEIRFENHDLKKDFKEGDRFIARLYLKELEYHHYGYKITFVLTVLEKKQWWKFWK